MNRNKRAFNIFNNEMPFLMSQPIPEPPRVINPRPMVPDLSFTSDVDTNGLPYNPYRDNFDKYKTIYPSPPKPQSPPQQQICAQNLRHFDTNHRLSERLVSTNLSPFNDDFNCVNQRTAFGLTEDNNNERNNIFTNGRLKDDKPIECRNSTKPKIIRHSTTTIDPVLNQTKAQPKSTKLKKTIQFSQPINTQNVVNSPTNEQMFELIKQQDIQLQKISEQIGELLRIQDLKTRIDLKEQKVNNSCNKRSVQTMTSIGLENNDNITPLCHKSRNRLQKGVNKPLRTTPTTSSKDLRALHLNTISECPSEQSVIELDSNRLNFSESPVRPLPQSSSIERIRTNNSSDSYDDHFYDQMINNIEVMLNKTSSEGTDEDTGRRSSCSPTPPQSKREPQHRKHQIQLQSEQTLYIKRLAKKYLVDDSEEYKTKHKVNKSEQKLFQNERTDLNVYGMTKNASIATKNYLEKYGLTYSPPRVQNSPNFFDNNKNRHKVNRNKILDIETLKRQPKLT